MRFRVGDGEGWTERRRGGQRAREQKTPTPTPSSCRPVRRRRHALRRRRLRADDSGARDGRGRFGRERCQRWRRISRHPVHARPLPPPRRPARPCGVLRSADRGPHRRHMGGAGRWLAWCHPRGIPRLVRPLHRRYRMPGPPGHRPAGQRAGCGGRGGGCGSGYGGAGGRRGDCGAAGRAAGGRRRHRPRHRAPHGDHGPAPDGGRFSRSRRWRGRAHVGGRRSRGRRPRRPSHRCHGRGNRYRRHHAHRVGGRVRQAGGAFAERAACAPGKKRDQPRPCWTDGPRRRICILRRRRGRRGNFLGCRHRLGFFAGRAHHRLDRWRRHAGRRHPPQLILRLCALRRRLPAGQRPADECGRAHRRVRRHSLVHHVRRHEPVPGQRCLWGVCR